MPASPGRPRRSSALTTAPSGAARGDEGPRRRPSHPGRRRPAAAPEEPGAEHGLEGVAQGDAGGRGQRQRRNGFARNAPGATPGQYRGPKTTSAAMAIPVGGQTSEMLSPIAAKPSPSGLPRSRRRPGRRPEQVGSGREASRWRSKGGILRLVGVRDGATCRTRDHSSYSKGGSGYPATAGPDVAAGSRPGGVDSRVCPRASSDASGGALLKEGLERGLLHRGRDPRRPGACSPARVRISMAGLVLRRSTAACAPTIDLLDPALRAPRRVCCPDSRSAAPGRSGSPPSRSRLPAGSTGLSRSSGATACVTPTSWRWKRWTTPESTGIARAAPGSTTSTIRLHRPDRAQVSGSARPSAGRSNEAGKCCCGMRGDPVRAVDRRLRGDRRARPRRPGAYGVHLEMLFRARTPRARTRYGRSRGRVELREASADRGDFKSHPIGLLPAAAWVPLAHGLARPDDRDLFLGPLRPDLAPASLFSAGVVRQVHGASDHRPVWAVVVPEDRGGNSLVMAPLTRSGSRRRRGWAAWLTRVRP